MFMGPKGMSFPILGLVGPSGSGKSTLIKALVAKHPEMVSISRSLTTRPKRNEEDEFFYRFTTPGDVRSRESQGRLTHVAEYAGHLYATDKAELNQLLSEKIGIAALVESGVRFLRQVGYRVIVIRIIPENSDIRVDESRQRADTERAKDGVEADHVIINSFLAGGMERSLARLETILLDI
jgi:guanylate kinase